MTESTPHIDQLPPPRPLWRHASAAVPGSFHKTLHHPCQDAAIAEVHARPYCIATDGKGSSPRSQHGSVAAVQQFGGILHLLEPLVSAALDLPDLSIADRQERWARAAQWIAWYLADEQRWLAADFGCRSADLEYTLAAVIVGTNAAGWIQVGDAAVVAEIGGVLGLVSAQEPHTYANVTEFLRPDLPPNSLKTGVLPSEKLRSVAVCSDGTAFLFVHLAAQVPAEAFSQIFEAVRDAQCDCSGLRTLLSTASWSNGNGDDRCLAVLCRCREEEAHSQESEAPTNTSAGSAAEERETSCHRRNDTSEVAVAGSSLR